MKCPNCGYEAPEPTTPPKPPYEYHGWLKPCLPLILKMLRAGQAPLEVRKTLLAIHGAIAPQHLIVPTIQYIRKRYGIELPADSSVDTSRRNREIATRYLTENISLRQLGREYGLSAERTRVIVVLFEREEARRKWEQEAIQTAHAAADGHIEDISLVDLNLSYRLQNCLANANLQTVGDVMKLSERELLHVPKLGYQSLLEWKKTLQQLQAAPSSPDQAATATEVEFTS